MKIQWRLRFAFVLLTMAGLVASCSGLGGEPQVVSTLPPEARQSAQTETTSAEVQPISVSHPTAKLNMSEAAQLYAENCVRCHGVSGKGDGEFVQNGSITSIVDFTDAAQMQDKLPAAYFEVITHGRLDKLMPPWEEKLNADQRWSLALYVSNLRYTPETLTQGKVLWDKDCSACHGANGEGTPGKAPLPDLTDNSTMNMVTTVQQGIEGKMPAYVDAYSAEDINAVVAYSQTVQAGGGNLGALAAANAGTSSDTVASAATLNPEITAIEPQSTPELDSSSTSETIEPQTTPELSDTTSGDTAAATAELENPHVDAAPQYEITADDSQIVINGIVTQVDVTSTGLQVFQLVSYVNNATTGFLKQNEAGESLSVSWRLPPEATYVDMGNGLVAKSDDSGTQVFDTLPAAPGEAHVIHLMYEMPYAVNITIEHKIDYPLTGEVDIMLNSTALTMQDPTFIELGSQDFSGVLYTSYAAEMTRQAGETVRYNLQAQVNPPVASTTGTTTTAAATSPLAYLMIGFGFGSIGLAAVLYIRERMVVPKTQPAVQQVAASTTAHVTASAASNTEVQALMKQIADLDIQHQQGKLNKASYEKQRSALKAKLTQLMKSQGK